ncbi:NirD/YgiW/YdeI family stress tolerance protein [Parasalinivibrio latis]|uniref:YgiW/YdeI family stress tolerance OB fold protein n=1 Tax=Parasalinivibrio latis TaxID=2952610 RepID=UPI0030DE4A4C
MKKYLVVTLGAALLSTSVFAANNAPLNGGFVGGPNPNVNTVEDVLNAGWLTDDTPVTLVGHIKMSLGGDRYLFADKTGEMAVEIDNDVWQGQVVKPETQIQISGDIDKDASDNAVDVETLQII